MSKYKGLFTFDIDNHKYVPIAQANGVIDTMGYEPDHKLPEPLIKDESLRSRLRAYAKMQGWKAARYSSFLDSFVCQGDVFYCKPSWELNQLEPRGYIPITELCGEEE